MRLPQLSLLWIRNGQFYLQHCFMWTVHNSVMLSNSAECFRNIPPLTTHTFTQISIFIFYLNSFNTFLNPFL